MKIVSILSASLFISIHLFAAGSGVVIGEIGYGGTGCVAGSLEVTQSESQISNLVFKEFKLSTRKTKERKACNLVIPIEVPKGVQVGVGPLDEIQGFHSLPSSTVKLTVNQEVFFAGTKGKVIPNVKKGAVVGPLKIENSTSLKDLRWSPCGQSVSLRVSLRALLENPTRKLAFASLESIKLSESGRLYWRQCN